VLAEQIGTLAAFAQAPLIVTLANGGRVQAFDAFGMAMASRARRLEELTTVLRALLAGESVTFHGRYLTLDGVRISPRPRVPVELWLAGTVPAAVARAGTLGDGWLTGQNAPDDELVRQLEVYREAATRAGRPARAVLRRDIFVAETDAAAHAEVDSVLAEGYRGTGKAELLVGSPETVIRAAPALPKAGLRGGHGAPHHGRPPEDARLLRPHRPARDAGHSLLLSLGALSRRRRSSDPDP
jgi:alkanesulfonate monooxygenase SsuD/methylene tetrahydromethanopterin reductase-like flavin-dependent oxidoreductase (luciferase family)